jgi:hyperosmotically inducible periplasmic protein
MQSVAPAGKALWPMKYFTLPLSLTAAIIGMLAAGSQLHASDADDRIESTFTSSYVYRTYLKNDAVKPVAKDGVLTLTGSVADESHKELAQETAAGLPGVTRVDNQLAIKIDAKTGSADLWIERKLQLALLFHSDVSATTSIEVKAGVVTLKGEAASSAARDLTGDYAKDIESPDIADDRREDR